MSSYLVSKFLVLSLILRISDGVAFRHKRQAESSSSYRPSEEMIKILRGFVPGPHPNCPDDYVACRDESFCFQQRELCGGSVACDDASDEYNAICLGTLPPETTVVQTTPGSNSPTINTDNRSHNNFGSPLVIAFICLVCGLFIYVSLATYCWTTNRWNAVKPQPVTT